MKLVEQKPVARNFSGFDLVDEVGTFAYEGYIILADISGQYSLIDTHEQNISTYSLVERLCSELDIPLGDKVWVAIEITAIEYKLA